MRILIVEDDRDYAFLLGEELQFWADDAGRPLERHAATTLAAALELLGRMRFDGVVTDLSLPDSTGPSTVARLAAAVPGTPIAVLTGYDDRATVDACLAAGAKGCLLKGNDGAEAIVKVLEG